MSLLRLIGKPICLAFGWRRRASSRKLTNPAAIYPARRFWERWPSGRRRAPAKGVGIKSPSRVRIPPSPPSNPNVLRLLAYGNEFALP